MNTISVLVGFSLVGIRGPETWESAASDLRVPTQAEYRTATRTQWGVRSEFAKVVVRMCASNRPPSTRVLKSIIAQEADAAVRQDKEEWAAATLAVFRKDPKFGAPLFESRHDGSRGEIEAALQAEVLLRQPEVYAKCAINAIRASSIRHKMSRHLAWNITMSCRVDVNRLASRVASHHAELGDFARYLKEFSKQ